MRVRLVLGILATYRLSSLLVSERGPFDVFGRLRDWAGVTYDDHSQPQGDSELAQAFTCIWCASIWVGGVVALWQGYRLQTVILRALAYSTGAIMIDRILTRD